MDLPEMQAALAYYDWFDQCLVQDVRWDRFGTTIHIDFDYIWDEGGASGGQLRSDFKLVTVSLIGVQELIVRNALTEMLLAHLNWSFSEISLVRLEQVSKEAYPGMPGQPYRLQFPWEGRDHRQFEVTFYEMRVQESIEPNSLGTE